MQNTKDIFRIARETIGTLLEQWTGTILALVTVISSIPFVSKYLYHIDSVQYALGFHHFNIADHQPHPPGYPVYVAMGKTISHFIHDDNGSLVIMSILFAAIGVALFFRLALAITRDRAAATVASLFLVFNPLFWFYREVALNYTSEVMTFAGVGLIAYRVAFEGKRRYFYLLGPLLAFSFGIRPSVFMVAPICVFTALYVRRDWQGFEWKAFYRGLDWKTLVIATCAGIAGVLAWLVPVSVLSGGLAAYYAQVDGFWKMTLHSTSAFTGAREVFLEQIRYFLKTLFVGSAGILVIIAGSAVIRFMKRGTPREGGPSPQAPDRCKTAVFFLFWSVPALATYTLGHFGQAGYHLSIMPALYLLSVYGVRAFLRLRPLVTVLAILFAFQVASFLLLRPIGLPGRYNPSRPPQSAFMRVLTGVNRWVPYYSAGQLRENDRCFAALKGEIAEEIGKAARHGRRVMLVVPLKLGFHSAGESYINEIYNRHIRYYFPGVDVVTLNTENNAYSISRAYRLYGQGLVDDTVPLGGARTVIIVAQGIDDPDMPAGLALKKRSYVYTGEAGESFSFLGYRFSR